MSTYALTDGSIPWAYYLNLEKRVSLKRKNVDMGKLWEQPALHCLRMLKIKEMSKGSSGPCEKNPL